VRVGTPACHALISTPQPPFSHRLVGLNAAPHSPCCTPRSGSFLCTVGSQGSALVSVRLTATGARFLLTGTFSLGPHGARVGVGASVWSLPQTADLSATSKELPQCCPKRDDDFSPGSWLFGRERHGGTATLTRGREARWSGHHKDVLAPYGTPATAPWTPLLPASALPPLCLQRPQPLWRVPLRGLRRAQRLLPGLSHLRRPNAPCLLPSRRSHREPWS